MSVTVREKVKGSGVWWLFVNHDGKRTSRKVGSKVETTRLADVLRGKLAAGDMGLSDINREPVEVELFSHYCDQWLNVVMPSECKDSTQRDYRSIHRVHLQTAWFYKTSIDQITESDIKNFIINKRLKKSWSTTGNIKNAISNVFKQAIASRVIEKNPCDSVKVPRGRKCDKKKLEEPLNSAEINTLLNVYAEHRYYGLVLFMARTGARTGEVAGLKWQDLDLANRKVHIQRAIVRGRATDTKNGLDRKVDLTSDLVAELKKLKIKSQKKGQWVFQNSSGGHVCMDNFRKRIWKPMLDKAELRQVRLHDLRHSFASLLIARNRDIYYAQRMLGHSSVTVTCDRYGHLLDEEKESRGVDALLAPDCTPYAPKYLETKKAPNSK